MNSKSKNIYLILSISFAVTVSIFLSTMFAMAETGGHKIAALQFKADSEGEVRTIYHPDTGDPIENAVDVPCFDGYIYDVASGREIGTATDCLNIQFADDGGTPLNPLDDVLKIIGTTIFELPAGTFISQGETSVQPVTWPDQPNTHITGAIPDVDDGESSIIAGTGKYKNSTGKVRLSGAVDLSAPPFIAFDCLFVVEFD